MHDNNIAQPSPIESTFVSQKEIKDLIGNPPNWLLRSGITMIAIVAGVFLSSSFFFKYPEKLTGSGILTSTSPPIELVSRGTGYIEKIYPKENDYVEKGSPILYISNTTDKNQLESLESWITNYKKIIAPNQYLKLEFAKNLQLGPIQSEYANLQLRYSELQQTLKDGVVFEQINTITQEINKIKTLNQSIQREKEIYKRELALTKRDYDRSESLNSNGVISTRDLEAVKTILLQKERQYEGMNNSIIQNKIRIEQLDLDKLELQEKRANTIKGFQFSIAEIINRIISSIQNWNLTYTIVSPISGKISFSMGINEKKNLKQGEPIGYILPVDSNEKYVSAIYPSGRVGNIAKGQKALIKFDPYPYKEFGLVISKVKSISKIPSIDQNGQSVYEVQIPIDDIIISDYQDTLKFRPNMTVITEIITKDKTIFERIFDQFLSLVKTQ